LARGSAHKNSSFLSAHPSDTELTKAMQFVLFFFHLVNVGGLPYMTVKDNGLTTTDSDAAHAVSQNRSTPNNHNNTLNHQVHINSYGLSATGTKVAHHQSLINSSIDTRKRSMYYHVHFPKTAGTTVSNLIMADICGSGNGSVKAHGWMQACSEPCPNAFVDTELSCALNPRLEHCPWLVIQARLMLLKQRYPVEHVVYITTLRRGSDRVVSQWAHITALGSWTPPPSVPRISNESLMLYLRSGCDGVAFGSGIHTWLLNGVLGGRSCSHNHNVQVALLADVPPRATVQKKHLEKAKLRLKTGDWVIGFTDHMLNLHRRLKTLAPERSQLLNQNAEDRLPMLEKQTPDDTRFNSTVLEELDWQSRFDNELVAWALEQSRTDVRFVGPYATSV